MSLGETVEHQCSTKIYEHASLDFFDLQPSLGTFTATTSVYLKENGAAINYFGLDELDASAKNNNELTIYHEAPHTKSNQSFRGIYAGESYGSFQGKVVVQRHAVGSDAKQLYKALIVGDKAKAHVMPQMEIYEDDISASHGASIGQLDEEAVFYLRSRAIDENAAKSLLIMGFLQEILNQIDNSLLKNTVAKKYKFWQSNVVGNVL